MARDYVEEIRNVLSIKNIVEEKVRLTKRGREYIGLCPFHKEKSPSFYVNPQKGFYYCFGCQARGNIFNFYIDIYSMSFKEALEALANKANIELPKNIDFSDSLGVKNLYFLCDIAKDYFYQNLRNKGGERAMEYLLKRGLSKEVIDEFELGYALGNNESLWGKLYDNDIYEEDILEVGLKNHNNNGEVYDFFRNRIIFPIKNKVGKVIAFGGRAMGDEMPKYLNTRESRIFKKKSSLYGIYESLKNFRDHGSLIIVEGYMDVIAMYQKGLKKTVASLGTAFTKEHIGVVEQYDREPIFCMDGDLAGKKATHRIIDLYIENLRGGINPRFVFLEEGKDPDSYLNENNSELFKRVLSEAKSISEVLWESEIINKNLSLPEVAVGVLKDLIDRVSSMKDGMMRNKFIEYFRNNLYKYGINQNRILYIGKSNKDTSSKIIIDTKSEQGAIMIACVLKYPELLVFLEDKLAECSFSDSKIERLRVFFVDHAKYIKNIETLNELVSASGLVDDVRVIFESGLIKPLSFESAEVTKHIFENTYKLVLKSKLEEENKRLQYRFKILSEKIRDLDEEISNCDNKDEVDALILRKKGEIGKVDTLKYQLKEITTQILQIK